MTDFSSFVDTCVFWKWSLLFDERRGGSFSVGVLTEHINGAPPPPPPAQTETIIRAQLSGSAIYVTNALASNRHL
jgi:hypothetical protein